MASINKPQLFKLLTKIQEQQPALDKLCQTTMDDDLLDDDNEMDRLLLILLRHQNLVLQVAVLAILLQVEAMEEDEEDEAFWSLVDSGALGEMESPRIQTLESDASSSSSEEEEQVATPTPTAPRPRKRRTMAPSVCRTGVHPDHWASSEE